MITLPNISNTRNLQHLQADYVSILLELLQAEYVDHRLITLMCRETREDIKAVFAERVVVLRALQQTMSEPVFIDVLCNIAESMHKSYGSGFTFKDGKRTEHNLRQCFNAALAECL
ncbi:hypothetical protein [Vibrio diazotrophicus]|uniref:hypothetical protein n=1 Tax=Vibrio diazotrophicus TaxID=685 RepID=UPI000C9E395F|nr:hypothetical protein [Vibrio diazotrophicus]PNH81358.1 hypothetical protein C1N27_07380 [Vibrio diazotrophicus]